MNANDAIPTPKARRESTRERERVECKRESKRETHTNTKQSTWSLSFSQQKWTRHSYDIVTLTQNACEQYTMK